MSSLDEIKELTAYSLAGMADCLSPDSLESPGAKMLVSVRDSVVGAIEEGRITLDDFDDSGQIHEIADNAPSVYTHQRWQQFADLGAYQEEPECDEWPSDLTETAGLALYQIADRLAHAVYEAWREGWQCPVCGDSGQPTTCTPDECYGTPDDDDDDQGDDGTPAEAVQTGPVDLDLVTEALIDRIRRDGEEAQVSAETASDVRRMDAMRIGHAIELKAWRVMVWTVAGIAALVGIVATVAVMS